MVKLSKKQIKEQAISALNLELVNLQSRMNQIDDLDSITAEIEEEYYALDQREKEINSEIRKLNHHSRYNNIDPNTLDLVMNNID